MLIKSKLEEQVAEAKAKITELEEELQVASQGLAAFERETKLLHCREREELRQRLEQGHERELDVHAGLRKALEQRPADREAELLRDTRAETMAKTVADQKELGRRLWQQGPSQRERKRWKWILLVSVECMGLILVRMIGLGVALLMRTVGLGVGLLVKMVGLGVELPVRVVECGLGLVVWQERGTVGPGGDSELITSG